MHLEMIIRSSEDRVLKMLNDLIITIQLISILHLMLIYLAKVIVWLLQKDKISQEILQPIEQVDKVSRSHVDD